MLVTGWHTVPLRRRCRPWCFHLSSSFALSSTSFFGPPPLFVFHPYIGHSLPLFAFSSFFSCFFFFLLSLKLTAVVPLFLSVSIISFVGYSLVFTLFVRVFPLRLPLLRHSFFFFTSFPLLFSLPPDLVVCIFPF